MTESVLLPAECNDRPDLVRVESYTVREDLGVRQPLRRSRGTLELWGLLRASSCTSKCYRCTHRRVDPAFGEEDLDTFEWLLHMSYQPEAHVNQSRFTTTQRIRAYAPLGSD